jgi:hypothetical protein
MRYHGKWSANCWEVPMPDNAAQHRKDDATGRLHPVIYRILMGFVGGWVILTISFFVGSPGIGDHPYGGAIVGVVGVLGLVAILILTDFWRIRLAHPGRRNELRAPGSFHDWLNREVVIWDGREPARDAAIMVLLPGIAAMLGGLALAIVFHLVAP